MSNAALDWAFQQTDLRSSDKFTLVALANRADDTGAAYPSVGRLCSDTGLNRKTVLRALSRLCDGTLITDSGMRRGATGGVIVYKLAVPKTDLLSSPKNGTVPKTEQSLFFPEAVPILPQSSPTFTRKQSQNRDTEPKGTVTEPSGEPKTSCEIEKRSTITGATVIPLILNTPEFRAAWVMWLEHLKQKRKSPSLHAQDLQLRKLTTYGPEKAVEIIHHCIEHNWQGIYEPKIDGQTSGTNRRPTVAESRNSFITGADRTKGQAAAVVARRRAEFDAENRKTQAARDALAAQVAGHGSDAPRPASGG